MTTSSATRHSGVCLDDLEFQLIVDGELDGVRLELAHVHLGACGACADRLRQIRQEALRIQDLFSREDEAEAEAATVAVARVQEGCRQSVAQPRHKTLVARRFGFCIAVAAAVMLAVYWRAADVDLTAAPGRILDEAMIRERAWMYRPGKVLSWVVESDITGSSRVPDGHYRTQQWMSTVKGAEGAILRKTDALGRLVFATWRRRDGSVVIYRRDAAEPLRIDPSPADIREELGAFTPEERQRLQALLDSYAQDSEIVTQGRQFAKWFLDAANSRRGVFADRMRTPDGKDGYYIRVQRGPGSRLDPGVVRLVMETYIEGEGFRRYRLRSQRDLADGRIWIEDARWLEFTETDLTSFEAHSLKDLLATMPAVRVTPREVARRFLGTAAGGGIKSEATQDR